MAKQTIIELLTERYFNAQFFEQQAVMDKVLACRSVSDFQKIKLDLNSPTADGIFAAASFSDPESKKLTNERLTQIFNNLKSVRGNSAFL